MRYGVISDVHANLPALRATLAALRRMGAERYVCAGDVVGYGPHPRECIEELQVLEPIWVLGNHELLLLNRLPMSRAGAQARLSIEWTRDVLPPELCDRLGALPETTTFGETGVVTHASLADPLLRLRSSDQIAVELHLLRSRYPQARFLIVGHTHRRMLASCRGRHRLTVLRRRVLLSPADPYVINPGSVGYSRERLGGACAALLDTEASALRFVRVPYDTAVVARDLARAGLTVSYHHLSAVRRVVERIRRRTTALS